MLLMRRLIRLLQRQRGVVRLLLLGLLLGLLLQLLLLLLWRLLLLHSYRLSALLQLLHERAELLRRQ